MFTSALDGSVRSRWHSRWEELPVSPAQKARRAKAPVWMWWQRENTAVFENGSPSVSPLALLANDWAIAACVPGRKLEIAIQGGRDTDWRRSDTD